MHGSIILRLAIFYSLSPARSQKNPHVTSTQHAMDTTTATIDNAKLPFSYTHHRVALPWRLLLADVVKPLGAEVHDAMMDIRFRVVVPFRALVLLQHDQLSSMSIEPAEVREL